MEILRLSSDHRRRRYPPEFRRRILNWVERAKKIGLRERQCADQLGLSTKRFETWRARYEAAESKALVRVEVREEPPLEAALAFVAPTGHRIEGVSLEQATALLRVFS